MVETGEARPASRRQEEGMTPTPVAEQLAAVAEAQRFSGAVALSRAGEVLFGGGCAGAMRRAALDLARLL
ncbi:hypothetical protein DAERI_100118 [Deinococcus aerius]|uniref:Uncharacterized protein n=2 Tax=Deinococcus aerius TaxID=200253 RepID=A0A2I9E039_9DEIO|nr:hypothetical protein DAERI_100118 [Deinococcus aerius]